MTTRLEKTYRAMQREKLNEGVKTLDETTPKTKPSVDDDPKVEVEDDSKQKKGAEPEKPSTAANRKADDKKKGLSPESPETAKGKKVGLKEAKKSKKTKKEEIDPDDDEDEDDDIEESKENAADRKKRGVPPKGALEEGQSKPAAANRKADNTSNLAEAEDEDDDDEDDDIEEGKNPFAKKGDDDDEDMDEGENPFAKKGDDDDKDKKDKKDKDDKDMKEEVADKKLEDELAESTKKAVSDMGDLLEGQASLEEDHKDQVKTLFEAALSDKTRVIRENLQEQHERKLAEAIDESEMILIESLNTYLDKVIAEWLDENKVELEGSIRTEITESFLGAMKHVFEDHYVDVPDEKLDLVENILDENEEMEEKLNEEMKKRMEAEGALDAYKKAEVIESLSEGLALTERERLTELTEEISYDDKESFEKKAKTIKENFFKESPKGEEEILLNEDAHVDDTAQSIIAKRYGQTISNMSVDKFDMKNRKQDK